MTVFSVTIRPVTKAAAIVLLIAAATMTIACGIAQNNAITLLGTCVSNWQARTRHWGVRLAP